MKLVRYGKAGKEKPGLIDIDGKLRDISHLVADLGGAGLSPRSLAKIAKARPPGLQSLSSCRAPSNSQSGPTTRFGACS